MASDRAQILITAIDQTKAGARLGQRAGEHLSSAAKRSMAFWPRWVRHLSVGALVAAGKAALDTADNLSKLSQKTGISVESLSLLKPIAEQSGVSLEGLAKGMQKLATAMVEAAGGSKEQVEAFSRLGVSVKDAAGQLRPTEDVLLDLADAFAAMPDGAEKSALAVKLFGKSGVELIPFLNQGRAGIEQLKQKFKELGLEISGDTAKAAEKFNDTLDTVKQALSGIAMKHCRSGVARTADVWPMALVTLASHGEEIMPPCASWAKFVTVLAVTGCGGGRKSAGGSHVSSEPPSCASCRCSLPSPSGRWAGASSRWSRTSGK
jgi:ribosomal protein L12E/L44/L45/RPP1/RPP2